MYEFLQKLPFWFRSCLFVILLGILCIELQRQDFYHSDTSSTSLFGSSNSGFSMSASGGVQNLTHAISERVSRIMSDTEVQKTLERISKDRPLYNQDGAVFENREKKLPIQKDRSYYHEWTIRTPDSVDRGTRRIIEGKSGDLYFTDDHYLSFVQIR